MTRAALGLIAAILTGAVGCLDLTPVPILPAPCDDEAGICPSAAEDVPDSGDEGFDASE